MTESQSPEPVEYRRARFVTRLPTEFLYSPSHFWIAPQPGGAWRVGITKFGARMLGEMVDHGFSAEPGAPVTSGQIIGWLEGFKAITDLYCIANGTFIAGNPALKDEITLVNQDPYGAGWLYEVHGQPDTNCTDVHAYCQHLDKIIDRMQERSE